MAKRFTDTDKWKKPFIRGMKAPYKLLWLYILDECDHAGIWQVDLEVAEIKIGERLNEDIAIKFLEKNISIFDNGKKWFIPDFIEFQYGQLNPENRAHNSVIKILLKNNLIDEHYKPLISPLQGAKDMDKDKELDMDKEKVQGQIELVYPFDSEFFKVLWSTWLKYRSEIKKPYKSIISHQAALKELSKYNELTACAMIEQSIANGWQGIFELKNKPDGKQISKTGSHEDRFKDAMQYAHLYRPNSESKQSEPNK